MTGYGRVEHRQGGIEVVVEARTVNHRFTEQSLKLPKALSHLERPLRQALGKQFARGRVDLSVSVNGKGGAGRMLVLDDVLAEHYIRQLRQLQHRFKLKGELEIGHLAGVRELLSVGESQPLPRFVESAVRRLVVQALRKVQVMRRVEGRALAVDLGRRLRAVEQALGRIGRRLPAALAHYQQRLRARVAELVGAAASPISPVSDDRFAQEIVLQADRSDVSEELVRLESHLAQFRGLLRSSAPAGRTMDFLLQEMNREINTLGSKANDTVISSEVVGLKGELEKLREQVQNVQ